MRNISTLLRKAAPFAACAALLALFAAPALHAEGPAASGNSRVITVSGEGEARAVPDQAQLSAGVVTQASTAAEALSQNNRAMNGVFAALKKLGIPDKAIQTSNFSVSPQYSNEQNGNAPRIVGYQVSNTVTVTVADSAKVGDAIDALVASGANQLNSVNFGFANPKPLVAQARGEAVKDAIDRAQAYARAAGVSLGPILSISEGGSSSPVPVMAYALRSDKTTIAAGEQSVSASVTITWAIR